jgi:hypothetical protein
MIGIEINGEFLELPIGTSTQVERNTPLALGDELIGEYSFPFIFKASSHNMKLCGFINEVGIIKGTNNIKIEASYYESNFFAYKGTLVAEYVNTNFNRPEEGEISVYFLAGISSFYQQAKNVLLKDIDLGGDRVFSNLSILNEAQSTWTKTSDQTDYVFAPIYNPGFLRADVTKYTNGEDVPEDVQPNFMNKIIYYSSTVMLAIAPNQHTLVPFIYLTYLLKRVFLAFNITITGDILEDADFKKLFIDNYQAIDWSFADITTTTKFNLKNHVPQDWNVAGFLLNLAKRYAFSFQFDFNNRICKIVQVNTLPLKATKKDMTYSMAANVKLNFLSDRKICGLTQNFDELDEAISQPDLSNLTRGEDVNQYTDLPSPSDAYENYYCLVKSRNQWYACVYEEGTDPIYVWTLLGNNIYDYEPENQTDSIETDITTINQLLYTDWRPNSQALFPYVNRPGNANAKTSQFIGQIPEVVSGYYFMPPSDTGYINFGMRLLYFHGMQPDTYNTAGGISVKYPFASPHIFNTIGERVGNCSAAFSGFDYSSDIGIVNKFWLNWLKLLSSQEQIAFTLLLKLHEYLQLQWEDIILIKNVPYLLTKIVVESPFSTDSQDTGKVQCEALRIIY